MSHTDAHIKIRKGDSSVFTLDINDSSRICKFGVSFTEDSGSTTPGLHEIVIDENGMPKWQKLYDFESIAGLLSHVDKKDLALKRLRALIKPFQSKRRVYLKTGMKVLNILIKQSGTIEAIEGKLCTVNYGTYRIPSTPLSDLRKDRNS